MNSCANNYVNIRENTHEYVIGVHAVSPEKLGKIYIYVTWTHPTGPFNNISNVYTGLKQYIL